MTPVATAKAPAPATKPAPAPIPTGPVPPLFRRIDWLAALIAFGVVMITYFITLAPEQTLEDSGELCTGSFYAGIPHPPGYPFWAIYSWLWTKLPISNVAWRVELGEAMAAAMACGMIALMVSRGSSMLMEGIEELKTMTGKWEAAICLVSGVVAGLMMGFGGVMWSESVAINRISLFGVPWVTLVLLCLLRWIYAPHQRRYLYVAMFFFGICATIHQTLLVAAMGIEIIIASRNHKLGRSLCLGNTIIYFAGWMLNSAHYTNMLDTVPMVKNIYNIVGALSIAGYIYLCVLTKISFLELCRDGCGAAFCLFLVNTPAMNQSTGSMATSAVLLLATFGGFAWLAWETRRRDYEWLITIALGILWAAGASFYFYEAIAGMTDPPMQWGYPRTVEGWFHALSRGQYERANPSNVFADPMHFLMQLGLAIGDIAGEFNWVVIFIALVPLLFFLRMQKREKIWISGLVAFYGCIGFLLVILMNPAPDRQSADLIKVFFTSSHSVIAIMAGYGLALTMAYMATHYERFRLMGLILGTVVLVPALMAFYNGVCHTFYGDVGAVLPLTHFYLLLWITAALVLAALAGQSLVRMLKPADGVPEQEQGVFALVYGAAAVICLGTAIWLAFFQPVNMPLSNITAALPRLFAKNQYSLPAIAGLMILGIVIAFILGLMVYRRRAPLVITMALFLTMPLCSALSHWASSEQRGHWFGYWFGHDMFTPPFVGPDGKLTYDAKLRAQAMKGPKGDLVYPEMDKDTILYGGTDPGRFCPTYMIFCESFIPHRCQPEQDQHFDRRDVYLITQNALADGTYLDYLRAQYYRSQQKDPPFFSELARNVLKDRDYETNLLAKVVTPLDWVFESRGANIEKRWRTFTSWFHADDFTNMTAFADKLRPAPNQDAVSKWVFDDLTKSTQDLIMQKGDQTRLRAALADDLNNIMEREWMQRQKAAQEGGSVKIDSLYDAQRFSAVPLSDYIKKFIAQDPQSDTRIRLDRLLLEEAYPTYIAKSLGGVYPDREIYIASNDDSKECFSEYIEDAAKRKQTGQLKPGEEVNISPNGQVQVSGQVAVMSINGLLTKVIFDHNPDNSFYVEESMPLDWMYPHLTPYGVIMKIERQPLPELSEEVVRRDHEFWSNYSERLIGNWIKYDTSVSNIVDFVERVYLHHDYTGFTGSRRFIRDDQAQKAFSKLRSSIAGIYLWRLGLMQGYPTPTQFQPKSDAERKRMIDEADFAFRQAFAYCPYSPEAVFRYVTFLTSPLVNRVQDALLVAETCRKLDPENGQVISMVDGLQRYLKQPSINPAQVEADITRLEADVKTNPTDYQKQFDLVNRYAEVGRVDTAFQLLDTLVSNPHTPAEVLMTVAALYQRNNMDAKVEPVLERLVQAAPTSPEAWFNLALSQTRLGRTNEAVASLEHALDLNAQRLKAAPKSENLRAGIEASPHFAPLQKMPAFQDLLKRYPQ